MTNQLDATVQVLREALLAGHYPGGDKLTEQGLSATFSVSRTLVRLALADLEREGLVERTPNRGFRVRSFTLEEVSDAIEVRGELEGMAVRLAGERGLVSEADRELGDLIVQMDAVLVDGLTGPDGRARWIDLNAAFHNGLIAASGNATLAETIAGLSRMPLVSARALVFDQSDPHGSLDRLKAAQADHRAVLDAVRARQGARAAHIMREHALKSARNKRASFDAMRRTDFIPSLPGLALVRA
ncbi:MAG: GntR family transcriptional regulator [Pseudomonadota bacterium]